MPARASSSACSMWPVSLESGIWVTSKCNWSSLREQRIHKFFRIERKEISCFFTDPYVTNGNAEFTRDRDDNSALSRPIQFGKHDSRDPCRLGEEASLLKAV